MNQGVVLGLLAGSLLAVGAAAGGPEDADAAAFRYAHGFDAQGSFSGTCDVLGVRFPDATAGNMQLSTVGARLLITETWTNETVLWPGQPLEKTLNRSVEQRVTSTRLPEGPVVISWPAQGHALFTVQGGDAAGSLSAALEGAHWASDAPASLFLISVQYHEQTPNDGIAPRVQGLGGPARTLRTDQAHVPIQGSGFLRMDTARIETPQASFELPPREQVLTEETTGVVVRRSLLATFGVLALDGLAWQYPAATGQLVCRSLEWTGTGVVHYRDVVGQAVVGGQTVPIDRRELTLEGTFQSAEAPQYEDSDAQDRVVVAGHSEGRFAGLALDFAPVAVVGGDLAHAGEAAAAALGVTAGLALWSRWPRLAALLYSRIGHDRALEHPVRAHIVDAARARPGLILRELVESTQRRYGVVRHHAQILAHLGLVRTLRSGQALHVYPAGVSLPEARRALLLDGDPPARFLWDLLRERERPLREALASVQLRFSLSRMGAWKVARRAERGGLVERRTESRGVTVRALE